MEQHDGLVKAVVEGAQELRPQERPEAAALQKVRQSAVSHDLGIARRPPLAGQASRLLGSIAYTLVAPEATKGRCASCVQRLYNQCTDAVSLRQPAIPAAGRRRAGLLQSLPAGARQMGARRARRRIRGTRNPPDRK